MKLGTVTPSYQLAYVGSTVSINCYSATEPMWKKDGTNYSIPSVWGLLTLTLIDHIDSGTYTCEGSLSYIKYEPFHASSILRVGVSMDEQINYSLRRKFVGRDNTFTCDADYVKWHFSKSEALPTTRPISYQKMLILQDLNTKHNGFYFCYGLKSAIPFIARAELRVYAEEGMQPAMITVTEGWPTKFRCLSNNTVVWYKIHLSLKDRHLSKKELFVGPELVFEKTSSKDRGYYECHSTTDTGETFRAIGELRVRKKKSHPPLHHGKVIELATIVGPREKPVMDMDLKIFDEPKEDCIKEGVWTRALSGSKCETQNIGNYLRKKVKTLPKSFHHSKTFEKTSTVRPKKKLVAETDLNKLEESQEDCIREGGSGSLEPKCKSITQCIKPHLHNGSAIFRDINMGNFVYYKCAPGFSLIGASIQECTPTGTWSGKQPTCKRILNSKVWAQKKFICLYVSFILSTFYFN